MSRRFIKNQSGLSLVELLIAMLILLIVSLAMMQTALVSIDSNMKNVIRDETVSLADRKMEELRNTAFSNLTAGLNAVSGYPAIINTTIRNANIRFKSNAGMVANSTITDINSNTKKVDMSIYWTWKGIDYSHSVSTIRQREQ